MTTLTPAKWLIQQHRLAIPRKLPPVLEWAKKEVRIPNGERGRAYDPDRTPWTRYPIQLMDNPGIRSITFVKPIQTGGTIAGIIAICRKIVSTGGMIQYNWTDDGRAREQWNKMIEQRLQACRPVREMWPRGGDERFKAMKCLVIFPNVSLTVQGVLVPSNLDSDSVGVIVNEEIHSWEPGMLAKAKGRQTAVPFPFMMNISNAGRVGDQLYEEWRNGTQQELEVLCPGCGKYHIMRTRYEERKPELGGLYYDSKQAYREDGSYDYNKLVPTIRYRFPCGHEMPDDVQKRRAVSATCRYSEPFNTGALASEVSLRYQAVACHDISWVQLIKEKHSALRALKTGNDEPWRIYLQERECEFYSPESRPFMGQVVLNEKIKKNRNGLPNRATRLWAADWQQGYKHKGQLSHYWLVIEDVLPNCSSQLVFEGMAQTDMELIALLDDHKCLRSAGVVDASKNTKAILEMCYRNGLNAVMGNASHKGSFMHKDKVRRFYSEDKPIHAELNMPPRFNYSPSKEGWLPSPEEPIVLFYNKAGLLANSFFISDNKQVVTANKKEAQAWEYIEREIPGDVSEEFKLQMESWERVSILKKQSNDEVEGFRKVRPKDHLRMCVAYVDMLKDFLGILGDQLALMGIKPEEIKS